MKVFVYNDIQTNAESAADRGVHYVHCVMPECIMVKPWGKLKTRKVCKEQVNFTKSWGGNFKKYGNDKFPEIGGKSSVLAKIGGKFKIRSQ